MLVSLSRKAILAYRASSPARVRASCRFTPSCSEYALLALEKYGFISGWGRTIKRLARCKPPHGGTDYP